MSTAVNFSSVATYSTVTNPFRIVAGDVNGDGHADLVVYGAGQGQIGVLLNTGSGSFGPNATTNYSGFALGTSFDNVVLGDINGDGNLDLVMAGISLQSGADLVGVAYGDGQGHFGSAQTFQTTASGSHDQNKVTVGDFNGDGRLDVAEILQYSNSSNLRDQPAIVSVLINNGQGGFQAAVNATVVPHLANISNGDLNGDGRPDLVVTSTGGTLVYFNKGDGTFQAPTPFNAGGSFINSAVERDFNGDGHTDLAISSLGTVSVYLNQGGSTFGPATNYDTGEAILGTMVAGDFNADGRLDLAGINNNVATVITGNGNGTFNPAVSFFVGTNPAAVTAADFDGNGTSDLAAAISDFGGGTTIGVIYGDPRYAFGTVTTDPHSLGGEVYALYDGLLGRAPDPVGLEHWAAQFAAGVSPSVLADAFLSSPEGMARSGAADNGTFLTQLYQATLHRGPDQAGFDHWMSELNAGTTRGTVGAGFALSDEHLGSIQPALNAGLFVGDEITSAVARVYYTVLARAPDAVGLAYWSSVVHSGTSLDVETAAFLQAPEVMGRTAGFSTAQFVDFVYVNALGRHAEQVGLDHWVDQIDHGGSRVDVTTAIGQSAEAQAHLLPLIEQGWHLT